MSEFVMVLAIGRAFVAVVRTESETRAIVDRIPTLIRA